MPSATSTPEFNKHLGAHIRFARIAAKMSQTALGEHLGITFQQVQKYENGKDRVSAEALVKISAAVGKPVVELLDFDAAQPVVPQTSAEMRETAKAATMLDRIADPKVRRRVFALVDALGEPAEVVPHLQAAE